LGRDPWRTRAIPGARGCTPQSCSLRDHLTELRVFGAAHLFGLSAQDTDCQREAVERLKLPFSLLSDTQLAFARSLKLSTFSVGDMTLLKRMVLIIEDGVIVKVLYPVFHPDKSADEVVTYHDEVWRLAAFRNCLDSPR
jgi:peroxiredoxin